MPRINYHHSKEIKRKIGLANSVSLKGYKQTEEHKEKLKKSRFQKGHPDWVPTEARKRAGLKISKTHKSIGVGKWMKGRRKNPKAWSFPKGEKHPMWKGGKMKDYPELVRLRKSPEYKIWRKSVFERDHYTCIFCGDNQGGNLESDHIKPFALFPELRFAIDNGRTLCEKCHKKTNTYGNNFNKIL